MEPEQLAQSCRELRQAQKSELSSQYSVLARYLHGLELPEGEQRRETLMGWYNQFKDEGTRERVCAENEEEALFGFCVRAFPCLLELFCFHFCFPLVSSPLFVV